jgi:hypothetical protein
MRPDQRRIRVALEARLEGCWHRLEDVVSELVALHEIPGDLVVERVRETIAGEVQPEDSTGAGRS